ncbi:MAG: hypothetical protein WCD89_04230 [Anaerocolumna sp.]
MYSWEREEWIWQEDKGSQSIQARLFLTGNFDEVLIRWDTRYSSS